MLNEETAQLLLIFTGWKYKPKNIQSYSGLTLRMSYSETVNERKVTNEAIRRKQVVRWLHFSRMKNDSYRLSKYVFGYCNTQKAIIRDQ